MRGAPVLNGVAGSLIGLLDTFLVDGWGLATANSLSVSGGVATLTMPAASEFEDHCVVLIAGATPAALNGDQRIATTNGTTLTFPTTVADGPATGTITVKYASCGWQKVFFGANLAVYRSQNVMGNRRFLRVQDTSGVDARIVAYNNMTAVSTGTGPFPTDAQISGGGYWPKSSTADSTPQRYDLLGDSMAFYFGLAAGFAPSGGTDEYYKANIFRPFGDPIPLKTTGDAWGTMLGVAPAAGYATYTHGSMEDGRAAGFFVERAVVGTGGPIETYLLAEVNSATSAWSGEDSSALGPFPNAVDGKLRFSRMLLRASSSDYTARSVPPGRLNIPQSGLSTYSTFKARDTVPGSGALAGRRIMLFSVGGGGRQGIAGFDITGPWR